MVEAIDGDSDHDEFGPGNLPYPIPNESHGVELSYSTQLESPSGVTTPLWFQLQSH